MLTMEPPDYARLINDDGGEDGKAKGRGWGLDDALPGKTSFVVLLPTPLVILQRISL